MGVIDKSEVISWVDEVISHENAVPDWLLNVSLAANDDQSAIEAKLRELPGDWNRVAAAYAAMDRFAMEFQVKSNYSSQQAAQMLVIWATYANLSEKDFSMALTPTWLADELNHPYGKNSDLQVIEAINACIAYFDAQK